MVENIEIDWASWKVLQAGELSSATVFYLQNDLQYVPFLVGLNGSSPATASAVYYSPINRDPSSVNQLSSGAKSYKVIQDITYTANIYGTAGDDIAIVYADDASSVGKEYVTVSGKTITVHIVDGVSTAQQVLTAVAGWQGREGMLTYSAASASLVSAVITGNSGDPQDAQASTPLENGVDAVTVISDWQNNFQGSATLVSSIANGIAAQIA